MSGVTGYFPTGYTNKPQKIFAEAKFTIAKNIIFGILMAFFNFFLRFAHD